MRYGSRMGEQYAWQNRLLMFGHVLDGLRAALGLVDGEPRLATDPIHCHHNYIAAEVHFGAPGLLTRKGADSM